MDILLNLLQETDKFLIILARMSGLALAPVFNTKNFPRPWKVALVLMFTYFIWQLGILDTYTVPTNTLQYILVIIVELMIGMILSLIALFFFAAVQLAGQLIDTQMGFGIMNVLDPMSGTQAPILGSFKFILAMLVYLQINGHHLFLQALFDSYNFIPIGHVNFHGDFYNFVVFFFGNIFLIGLKLSIPIVGSLIIVDIVMGIMAKSIPQMNVFMVGMPAKIILGFLILLVTIPLYVYLLNSLIENMIKGIYMIIRSLA